VTRKRKTVSDVKVTGIADRGKAVARTEEGQVIFVDHGVPGDIVDAMLMRKKKSFYQARTTAVKKYSIHKKKIK